MAVTTNQQLSTNNYFLWLVTGDWLLNFKYLETTSRRIQSFTHLS